MAWLADPGLLRSDLLVDGRWVPAADGGETTVHDPATGARIGVVAAATEADVEGAIDAARRAFDGWAKTPAPARPRSGGC